MKVNVKKDALLKALQKVSNIIGNRTTLPVLANVLLEADNGKLTLTTTDLELRINTSIEAEVEESGVTTCWDWCRSSKVKSFPWNPMKNIIPESAAERRIS